MSGRRFTFTLAAKTSGQKVARSISVVQEPAPPEVGTVTANLSTLGSSGGSTLFSTPVSRATASASIYTGTTWSKTMMGDGGPGVSTATSMSCPSTTFCAAVGQELDENDEAVLFNGTSWTPVSTMDLEGHPSSVSCASPSSCLAVDDSGHAVTFNGSSWSIPTAIDPDDGLAAVSCPTSAFCVATDSDGNAVVGTSPG